MSVLEIVAGVLLVAGSFMVFIAAIGLLRLPDVLCRSHAVGKALTLGVSLLLLALFCDLQIQQQSFRVFLILAFQFLTIPISAHLLCRLALRRNIPRYKERPMDRHDV